MTKFLSFRSSLFRDQGTSLAEDVSERSEEAGKALTSTRGTKGADGALSTDWL